MVRVGAVRPSQQCCVSTSDANSQQQCLTPAQDLVFRVGLFNLRKRCGIVTHFRKAPNHCERSSERQWNEMSGIVMD
jgi:hypothetical protein